MHLFVYVVKVTRRIDNTQTSIYLHNQCKDAAHIDDEVWRSKFIKCFVCEEKYFEVDPVFDCQ